MFESPGYQLNLFDMGIGVEDWRRKIGNFFEYGVVYHGTLHLSGHVSQSFATHHLACVLAVQLLTNSIEPNLDPPHKLEEVAHHLVDLMQKLRYTHVLLASNIDDSVPDPTVKLHQ